jgi:hypothetical protein
MAECRDTGVEHVLKAVSLCTYSSGSVMVREVLDDWLQFLGGRPRQIIFAVSPVIGAPAIYDELLQEGKIDRIIGVEPKGRSSEEIEPEAIHLAINAAPTEWVLMVKLDTLCYRSGRSDWLAEAMELVQRQGLFGMTGSGPPDPEQRRLNGDYCVTQKFSNNFSLFRRADWLSVVDTVVDQATGMNLAESPQFAGKGRRYLNEHLIEEHLKKTGNKMLMRFESLDWSISHVNVWGETLRQVRESYIQRKGVKPFLNRGPRVKTIPLHPWDKYYGYPRPPVLKLLRILVGRWRRNFWT